MKKVKSFNKRLISILLALVMVVSVLPMNMFSIAPKASTNHGEAEAVSWIKARGDENWWRDVDGVYGCQCVDLIMAYYEYLVGYRVSGHACDYLQSSKWPSGWYMDSIPAPGAIIVWDEYVYTGQWTTGKNGHVGLVYAVSGSNVYTVETNTGGTNGQGTAAAAKYCTRMNVNAKYIHPDFEPITSKPTNLSISANLTSIGVGDTVTFTYNIEGATNKCIGIDKNGTRYKSIGVSESNGTATYTFKEAGTYCCIIEGSNSLGYSCSTGVWITVIDTKPKNLSISANFTSVGVGDSVTFNYKITGATVQGIGIDKNGKRYDNVEANKDVGTSSYTFKEPGTYCCIIEGYNSVGYNCSSGVWITVHDPNQTFNITYNPNGGENAPENQTQKYNEVITLSTQIPTREGYKFLGWSTIDNATSAMFQPGDSYGPNKDITLYAVWEENTGDFFEIQGNIKTFGQATDDIYIIFFKPGETESCGYTTIEGDATDFCITGIEAGEYELTVIKENHVERFYEITTDNGDINLDIQLNLIGDLNGDGRVNTIDVARANAHAKGVTEVNGYEFNCVDINGDGRVNTLDVARMNAHAKGVTTLW